MEKQEGEEEIEIKYCTSLLVSAVLWLGILICISQMIKDIDNFWWRTPLT